MSTHLSSRRAFLAAAGAVMGAGCWPGSLTDAMGRPASDPAPAEPVDSRKRVPLIHTTDLYHPPQDPDDHVDLATLYALPELDLRAIVLDPSRRFLDRLEPGYVPVAQLNYLTGRAVPAAAGPPDPLRSPTDTAADRPRRDQAGIELLLATLRRAEEPVYVTVVGSARVLAAAWNREPRLLREKIRSVLLNAGGSSPQADLEWNVTLDPHAYVALFRSDLPIDWYPCGGEKGPFDLGPRNTFWPVSHRHLFAHLPRRLRAWFEYAFLGCSRGDVLRSLEDLGAGAGWEKLLAGQRNMWCTASFITMAGRALARTPAGWRFVPAAEARGLKQVQLELLPVTCEAEENGVVRWRPSPTASRVRLFQRQPDAEHVQAFGEALAALWPDGLSDV